MAVTFDKIPASRPGTNTTIVSSGSSQATATFGPQCYQIRVSNGKGSQVFVKVGDGTPVASTADSMVLGTNVVDYFCVTPGQKIAVIGDGTASTVSITEMS
jgi:hypothetical protein